MFDKQGSLARQLKSAPSRGRAVSRSRGVSCAWGSEARLLKEIQQVGQDVRVLRTEVQGIRTAVRVLKARIESAVIVSAGAYLAPVLGFAALANSLGFLDKLKH